MSVLVPNALDRWNVAMAAVPSVAVCAEIGVFAVMVAGTAGATAGGASAIGITLRTSQLLVNAVLALVWLTTKTTDSPYSLTWSSTRWVLS